MKKILLILFIISISACDGLINSRLTITNNCSDTVQVTYSYTEDDYGYADTVSIESGERKNITIYANYAYVSVYAKMGTESASYHYWGGNHSVTMEDDDFY